MRLPSKHLKIVFQPRDAVSSITKGIYNIHWESRNVTEMCWSCGTSAISQISQDQLNINSGTSRLECGNLPDQLNNVAEPRNTILVMFPGHEHVARAPGIYYISELCTALWPVLIRLYLSSQ